MSIPTESNEYHKGGRTRVPSSDRWMPPCVMGRTDIVRTLTQVQVRFVRVVVVRPGRPAPPSQNMDAGAGPITLREQLSEVGRSTGQCVARGADLGMTRRDADPLFDGLYDEGPARGDAAAGPLAAGTVAGGKACDVRAVADAEISGPVVGARVGDVRRLVVRDVAGDDLGCRQLLGRVAGHGHARAVRRAPELDGRA